MKTGIDRLRRNDKVPSVRVQCVASVGSVVPTTPDEKLRDLIEDGGIIGRRSKDKGVVVVVHEVKPKVSAW